MTINELRSLRRGDVVQFEQYDLGLVVANDKGVFVRWEDGDSAGPYRTEKDAAMLSIFSKVPR